MKCDCSNTKEFFIEEKVWVKYFYKEDEDGVVKPHDIENPTVSCSCDEPDQTRAYCTACGKEVSLDEFEEWAWSK